MRNAMLQLVLVLIGVTSVHAVKLLKTSSLHAMIFPSAATEKVWAIQGNDSLEMTGSEGDYLLTNLPPGHWRVWVEAKNPYRDASFEIMDLRPGTRRDLGEIKLQQF